MPEGQYDLGNGTTVAVHGIVDPVSTIRDPAPGIKDAVAPQGFRWVAVDLEYFNHSDEPVDMSLMYNVELHTSDSYEATSVMLDRADMPAVGTTIPPEASLRGWKAFQVPEGAEPATLLLYGGEIGADPVTIELP